MGFYYNALTNKYVDNKKLDRSITLAGTILLILVIAILGVLFSKNVRYHSPQGKPRQAVLPVSPGRL